MIKFVSGGSSPDYPWGSLLDVINFHRPEYSRLCNYQSDIRTLMEIIKTHECDVKITNRVLTELELHFKDPHQELLFKLKYL